HDTAVFVVIFPIGCAVGIADAVGAPLLPALVDRIGGRPMLAGMVVALLAARITGEEVEILTLVGADHAAGATGGRKQGRPVHAGLRGDRNLARGIPRRIGPLIACLVAGMRLRRVGADLALDPDAPGVAGLDDVVGAHGPHGDRAGIAPG